VGIIYNCALDKNIDRYHMHERDDAGLSELSSKIENNYICDVWRKLYPEKNRDIRLNEIILDHELILF